MDEDGDGIEDVSDRIVSLTVLNWVWHAVLAVTKLRYQDKVSW